MAVVKLGRPVKSNLGGLNGAMAYIINPAKTDGGRLVSSNYERTRTDYDALAEGMLNDNEDSPKGIQENSRLADTCEALKRGDYETVGKNIYATHHGMSKLYEVSTEELDFLNDVAKECGVTCLLYTSDAADEL